MTEKIEYDNFNIYVSDGQGTVGNGKYGSGLIKGSSFSGSIIIPKKINNSIFITEMSDNAFRGCTNLKSVRINARLTRISKCCFNECYGLEYVSVPSSVSVIDVCAFSMYPGYSKVKLVIDFELSTKLVNVEYGGFEFQIGSIIYFRQIKTPTFHSTAFLKSQNCTVYAPVDGMNFGGVITRFSPYCLEQKITNYILSYRKVIFLINTMIFLLCIESIEPKYAKKPLSN